jgi:hypothetical protein
VRQALEWFPAEFAVKYRLTVSSATILTYARRLFEQLLTHRITLREPNPLRPEVRLAKWSRPIRRCSDALKLVNLSYLALSTFSVRNGQEFLSQQVPLVS